MYVFNAVNKSTIYITIQMKIIWCDVAQCKITLGQKNKQSYRNDSLKSYVCWDHNAKLERCGPSDQWRKQFNVLNGQSYIIYDYKIKTWAQAYLLTWIWVKPKYFSSIKYSHQHMKENPIYN